MTMSTFRRRLVREPAGAPLPVVEWCAGRDPGSVVVQAGEPIRIAFHRVGPNATSRCVCFPDFGIISSLAAGRETIVELGPQKSGRYRFCAVDQDDLEGWLLVEPRPGAESRLSVKLHRCGLTWLRTASHACWRVQQALEDQGIAYEVVTGPLLPGRRHALMGVTGQRRYPVIEYEDGKTYRADPDVMVRRIRSGGLLFGFRRDET
ncbi:MAG: cupredoxin domain-containing protein [Gemmatimonadaceae bacterium]